MKGKPIRRVEREYVFTHSLLAIGMSSEVEVRSDVELLYQEDDGWSTKLRQSRRKYSIKG
jgi:hypothetical protein